MTVTPPTKIVRKIFFERKYQSRLESGVMEVFTDNRVEKIMSCIGP